MPENVIVSTSGTLSPIEPSSLIEILTPALATSDSGASLGGEMGNFGLVEKDKGFVGDCVFCLNVTGGVYKIENNSFLIPDRKTNFYKPSQKILYNTWVISVSEISSKVSTQSS